MTHTNGGSAGAYAKALLAAVASLAAIAGRAAGENLVANGSFDRVEAGRPVGWRTSGDDGVTQELSVVAGDGGGHVARLRCTAFRRSGPASHAMLAQVGEVRLVKGRTYRFSCRLRAEGLGGRSVRLAVSDTSVWRNCGLNASLAAGRTWRRHERYFTASRTVGSASRLQLWFGETGTLYVDDVSIVAAGGLDLRYTDRIAPAGGANLLPNASFECGSGGWASLGRRVGWGNLSGLVGRAVEADAPHGRRCLRVDLAPGRTPVTYFDYFTPVRVEQDAPLAANIGWIELAPARRYTLSAWMRADREGVPARLVVRQCDPAKWPTDADRRVRLSRRWQRFDLTVRPRRGWAFVAVGPDLAEAETDTAAVWIDAVQFEAADAAGEFAPREPVEVGLDTGRFGNVFFTSDDRPTVRVTSANAGDRDVALEFTATATDYFGRKCRLEPWRQPIPAGQTATAVRRLALSGPGHWRVTVSWRGGGVEGSRSLTVVAVRRYRDDESPFGINHAPPSAGLCRLLRDAGVVWARDWSLKWQHIEPGPGRFDPAPAEAQIDRVLATGMQQVCLLPPFPSANWASSAPKALDTSGYPGVRLAMAYAPEDPNLLAGYIRRCVKHFAGRVGVWEFLNEPVFTDYSLPAANKGLPGAAYTAADYARLLRLAHATIKQADPNCRVIGGIGAGPDHLVGEFLAAGGLDHCDILNLHIYPGSTPPEAYIEPMAGLRRRMRRAGALRPVWITEFSYYGVDTPPWRPYVPRPGHWAGSRLLADERQCADYCVRFMLVMLAGGAEKVFYHSGSSGEVNRDSLECCLLGPAGVPRKAYVAQAALADVLGPSPRFVTRLEPPADAPSAEGVHALAFQCGRRAVVAAWADPYLARPGWRLDVPEGVTRRDVTAAPLTGSAGLGASPVYAIDDRSKAEQLARRCRLSYHPSDGP